MIVKTKFDEAYGAVVAWHSPDSLSTEFSGHTAFTPGAFFSIDPPEIISKCLNCPFPVCTNCLAPKSKKPRKKKPTVVIQQIVIEEFYE